MERREFLKATVLTPVAGFIALDNTVMSATKYIVVDDSMVRIHFGVSSYEEFDPYTGPFSRMGDSDYDNCRKWIENNPKEHKRNLWEGTRQAIHEELSSGRVKKWTGNIRPNWQYTQDGQVIPSKPVPSGHVSYRDYQGQIVSFMPYENIVVDDDMVRTCFGVKSWKDIEISFESWKKTGDIFIDEMIDCVPNHFFEWVTKYPDEYKKVRWETIRQRIQMQLATAGSRDKDVKSFVQNGQVIPNSIKNEWGLQGAIGLHIPGELVEPQYSGEYVESAYFTYPSGFLMRNVTCIPMHIYKSLPYPGRCVRGQGSPPLTLDECRKLVQYFL